VLPELGPEGLVRGCRQRERDCRGYPAGGEEIEHGGRTWVFRALLSCMPKRRCYLRLTMSATGTRLDDIDRRSATGLDELERACDGTVDRSRFLSGLSTGIDDDTASTVPALQRRLFFMTLVVARCRPLLESAVVPNAIFGRSSRAGPRTESAPGLTTPPGRSRIEDTSLVSGCGSFN